MSGEAYRRFLWNSATVKRNTTAQSSTGVSTFVYSTILEDVPCNIQNRGGRLRQDEFGQVTGQKYFVLFAREMVGELQANDLLVVNGHTFRIVHAHESWYVDAHHVECEVEPYIPAE